MKLCKRLFSYKLEHDASHLTDWSLHSEPCERQQCKRNARTKLPPVATKYRCTTTSHCFNLQVQHATMPSPTGALRSSWLPGLMTTITLCITYFQVGHWVASRNSVPWCCRTTAVPSAPPRHAWQNLPYRHKIAPAMLIHESVLILYTNIKTNYPKNSSIPWCRGSHMFIHFHMEILTQFTK